MQLKGDEYGFDPGLPSDRPSVILFIDRSSDSLNIRRNSKESLTVLRELALQDIVNPQKSFMEARVSRSVSRHPKLELATSSLKGTALNDKITIMAMKEGSQITFDDFALDLQGRSLEEVLAYVLEQKKQRKLSSLAKDAGFQLLSDDIDISMSETNVQSEDKLSELSIKGLIRSGTNLEHSAEDAEKILSVKTEALYQEELVTKFEDMKPENGSILGFNCSFFFVDGQFRLLEALTGGLKIPSLMIIDPLSHQHYVYPEETDFSYASLSGFLQMFLNESLLPFQRSKSVFPNSKEAPRPPFVNQDFHEVDSIPHVNALTFTELVVGNYSGSDNAWKKDVLVLFTSSWCGFCLRTELVVREVYRAFKGYGSMVKSQFRNAQSSSRNGKSERKFMHIKICCYFVSL